MKNKIKILFGCLIVLIIAIIFVLLKFRPKMVFPFIFGFWDPFILYLSGFVGFRILKFFLDKKKMSKKTEISKFQLKLIFLVDQWHIHVNFIEEKINKIFPNVFFNLCKYCCDYCVWDEQLGRSKSIFKRALRKFLIGLSCYPSYLGFFLDIYYKQWYFIFWGFVFSFFIHLFLVTLMYRFGRYYAVIFFAEHFPEEKENFVRLIKNR